MKFRSLDSFRVSNTIDGQSVFNVIESVFNAPGQIRRIDVATAYTDIDALNALIVLITSRGDQRSGVKARIFLDYQSSCKLADELRDDASKEGKKLLKVLKTTEIKKKGRVTHHIELIAVQFGALFHSKAFVMETNTHWASCVGSVNFTTRGFTANEEVAITEVIDQSTFKNTNGLAKQVLEYFDSELTVRAEITPFQSLVEKRKVKSGGLRDLFLEGRLWYEDKDQTAFTFHLNFPDKIRIRDAEVNGISIPNVESKLGGAISVLKLIDLEENSTEHAPKSRWRKQYCIQTCLGLWAPTTWTEHIDKALVDRKENRKKWLEKLTSYFADKQGDIRNNIINTYKEIWNSLKEVEDVNGNKLLDDKDLETLESNLNKLEQNAKYWVERINTRLGTEAFKRKLISGVSSVEMPDLWGANPSDAKNFESSFFDQLEYEASRAKSRQKRSYIATNMQNKLEETESIATREKLIEIFTKNGDWILGHCEEGSIENSDDIDAEDD